MGCHNSSPVETKLIRTAALSALKKKRSEFPVEGGLDNQKTMTKPSVHFAGELGLPATSSHRKLRIIHFNDCYNIEENPKKQYPGGAARFVSAINHY